MNRTLLKQQYARMKDDTTQSDLALSSSHQHAALVKAVQTKIKEWLQAPKPSLVNEVVIATNPAEGSPKLGPKGRSESVGFAPNDLLEAGQELASLSSMSSMASSDFSVCGTVPSLV